MPRLRSSKHERFAHAVAALTPLGTAYREAGFRGDERWHPYNASKLANKPEMKARIEELRLQFERTCAHGAVVHADYVRLQLLPLIETDGRELYEPDPENPSKVRLRPIESLPPHVAKAITRIKIDAETGRPVEIVLASKIEAAGTLLRSIGGFVDKHELSGGNGGPIVTQEISDEDRRKALAALFAKFKAKAETAAVQSMQTERLSQANETAPVKEIVEEKVDAVDYNKFDYTFD
jgi:hypothetical protein